MRIFPKYFASICRRPVVINATDPEFATAANSTYSMNSFGWSPVCDDGNCIGISTVGLRCTYTFVKLLYVSYYSRYLPVPNYLCSLPTYLTFQLNTDLSHSRANK